VTEQKIIPERVLNVKRENCPRVEINKNKRENKSEAYSFFPPPL
jgi:hypothetical protein